MRHCFVPRKIGETGLHYVRHLIPHVLLSVHEGQRTASQLGRDTVDLSQRQTAISPTSERCAHLPPHLNHNRPSRAFSGDRNPALSAGIVGLRSQTGSHAETDAALPLSALQGRLDNHGRHSQLSLPLFIPLSLHSAADETSTWKNTSVDSYEATTTTTTPGPVSPLQSSGVDIETSCKLIDDIVASSEDKRTSPEIPSTSMEPSVDPENQKMDTTEFAVDKEDNDLPLEVKKSVLTELALRGLDPSQLVSWKLNTKSPDSGDAWRFRRDIGPFYESLLRFSFNPEGSESRELSTEPQTFIRTILIFRAFFNVLALKPSRAALWGIGRGRKHPRGRTNECLVSYALDFWKNLLSFNCGRELISKWVARSDVLWNHFRIVSNPTGYKGDTKLESLKFHFQRDCITQLYLCSLLYSILWAQVPHSHEFYGPKLLVWDSDGLAEFCDRAEILLREISGWPSEDSGSTCAMRRGRTDSVRVERCTLTRVARKFQPRSYCGGHPTWQDKDFVALQDAARALRYSTQGRLLAREMKVGGSASERTSDILSRGVENFETMLSTILPPEAWQVYVFSDDTELERPAPMSELLSEALQMWESLTQSKEGRLFLSRASHTSSHLLSTYVEASSPLTTEPLNFDNRHWRDISHLFLCAVLYALSCSQAKMGGGTDYYQRAETFLLDCLKLRKTTTNAAAAIQYRLPTLSKYNVVHEEDTSLDGTLAENPFLMRLKTKDPEVRSFLDRIQPLLGDLISYFAGCLLIPAATAGEPSTLTLGHLSPYSWADILSAAFAVGRKNPNAFSLWAGALRRNLEGDNPRLYAKLVEMEPHAFHLVACIALYLLVSAKPNFCVQEPSVWLEACKELDVLIFGFVVSDLS